MEIRDCLNILGSALFCVMAVNREMINHPCYLFNKKEKKRALHTDQSSWTFCRYCNAGWLLQLAHVVIPVDNSSRTKLPSKLLDHSGFFCVGVAIDPVSWIQKVRTSSLFNRGISCVKTTVSFPLNKLLRR